MENDSINKMGVSEENFSVCTRYVVTYHIEAIDFLFGFQKFI